MWLWTLNRPAKRNALRREMFAWIAERAAQLAGEVVVIRGAGGRVFSSGFDLDALPEPGLATVPDAALIAASKALEVADATLIAAVDGPAIGAAVELLCRCDFQVAHPGVWCRVPAASLGVVYHADGLAAFHARLGSALARRLLVAGEKVDATELHGAGFLSHIVAADEVGPRAYALAETIAANNPASTRAHRQMFRALDHGQVTPELLQLHTQARVLAYARITHGNRQGSDS